MSAEAAPTGYSQAGTARRKGAREATSKPETLEAAIRTRTGRHWWTRRRREEIPVFGVRNATVRTIIVGPVQPPHGTAAEDLCSTPGNSPGPFSRSSTPDTTATGAPATDASKHTYRILVLQLPGSAGPKSGPIIPFARRPALAEPLLDTTPDSAEIVLVIRRVAAWLERRRTLERAARGRADAKANGVRPGRSALQLNRDLDVQDKTSFVLSNKLREAVTSMLCKACPSPAPKAQAGARARRSGARSVVIKRSTLQSLNGATRKRLTQSGGCSIPAPPPFMTAPYRCALHARRHAVLR